MKRVNTSRLIDIALVEFADIVDDAYDPDINELRILLVDGSFVDIWWSLKLERRYSFHWERKSLDGKIYRHDNAPHKRWRRVKTYPRYFHNGSEDEVVESDLSESPEEALRQFLTFIRNKIT
ncbi:toxin-antitoxin system TumE family protein [Moorella sp. Hama-1]|uniref:toxin-antitoxin system TumE family protein n=1 Tax=Moorella sp. Hama-1 TaxID=2138101 RepID=UPI000D653FB0|nr:DUF6516 family protein [Moorella sp. Hama-1]BCV21988.1 hypothetical protein hamaS1_20570 [Moorella sp. Hama-1]